MSRAQIRQCRECRVYSSVQFLAISAQTLVKYVRIGVLLVDFARGEYATATSTRMWHIQGLTVQYQRAWLLIHTTMRLLHHAYPHVRPGTMRVCCLRPAWTVIHHVASAEISQQYAHHVYPPLQILSSITWRVRHVWVPALQIRTLRWILAYPVMPQRQGARHVVAVAPIVCPVWILPNTWMNLANVSLPVQAPTTSTMQLVWCVDKLAPTLSYLVVAIVSDVVPIIRK